MPNITKISKYSLVILALLIFILISIMPVCAATPTDVHESSWGYNVTSEWFGTNTTDESLMLLTSNQTVDPTWNELSEFLDNDSTMERAYVKGQWECGNSAISLSNNATRKGIKNSILHLDLQSSDGQLSGHFINAFTLIDGQMIYVDITRKPRVNVCPTWGLVNLDIGKEYIRIFGNRLPLTMGDRSIIFEYWNCIIVSYSIGEVN